MLSHRDAAALWGLVDFTLDLIDVTVPGSSRDGPRGIRRHGARSLTNSDRAVRDAAILPSRLVQRAYEEAAGNDLLDVGEFRDPRS